MMPLAPGRVEQLTKLEPSFAATSMKSCLIFLPFFHFTLDHPQMGRSSAGLLRSSAQVPVDSPPPAGMRLHRSSNTSSRSRAVVKRSVVRGLRPVTGPFRERNAEPLACAYLASLRAAALPAPS